MKPVLEPIDERTLWQAIRLGIREGARRMQFRPGCRPLCVGGRSRESRSVRFRQLTCEDTEAIAGFLLQRAWVPERLTEDPRDTAHPLTLLCELPGEALLQVEFESERGRLAIAVDIALPLPADSELDLGDLA